MPNGYMGKLLFVDLTKGEIKEEVLDEKLCNDYLGGYGIGARILYDRMKPGVDPLGPDNILGLVTGPLTGTPSLIGSRYVVVAKSPLTGTWGDANCGGYFGPALKFAGFDGVFLTGASSKPVYLLVNNGKAELRDASYLWGKSTLDTEDILRFAHGSDVQLACIGPSGENLSLISCVVNNKGRAAGRSGLGAVMGSKRLKAVVAKGRLKVPMADEARVNALRREWMGKMAGFGPILHEYGTSGITADSAMSGDSPVKNWGGAGIVDFPRARAISDKSVVSEQDRRYACWMCPIACGGEMKPKAGRAPFSHKPEYETLAAAGTMALIDDLESIIKINDICNAYGLDTISAPCTVAFAIECYENGIITKEDTGGIELTWGNGPAAVRMTELLAKREGFGAVLADGVKLAAQRIGRGAEKYAIHVQGQEVPMHDPKFVPGLSVTYRLDATPARHTQGGELVSGVGVPVPEHDKYDYTGTGKIHKELVQIGHVVNTSGICLFAFISYNVQFIPDFLSAVTGKSITYQDCLKVGERIANLRHAFNLREGLNPLTWEVPGRVDGYPPLTQGNVRGVSVDYKTMVADYLKEMNWDPQTTKPSPRKLAELGLEDIAKDMQAIPIPAV